MRFLTALVVFFAVLAGPAAAAKCPTGARCGSVEVPVDRAGSVPGTFSIAYSVLPAKGPRTGTIVLLAGGPGESAIVYTKEIGKLLEPLRAGYDIAFVDQRGTGRSDAFECDVYDEGDYIAECGRQLGDRRAFLTTVETARDLDAVRARLGVEQIIPLGVSYGTKVAGEYARRFPQHTAAVVLDSPVGVGPMDYLYRGRIQAMPRVLRETCAAGPCADTVADAGAALFGAVARLKRPMTSDVVMGRDIVGRTKTSERWLLLGLLLSDVDPVLRADLPASLASLARGDAVPYVHLESRAQDRLRRRLRPRLGLAELAGIESYFTESRFLATACLESQLPWATTSAPATRAAAGRAYLAQLGTLPFAPFRPALIWNMSMVDRCRTWPATVAPEAVPDAGPDVPVLILAGRADLRTSLELAQQVAAAYPRATVLDVPHVGHSVLTTDESECAVRGLTAFLAARAPERCTNRPPLPAGRYLPASARGMSAGTVARFTVEGVLHDLHASRLMFGERSRYELLGLRAGWSDVRRGRIELHDVSWFRGVRVSGTVSLAGRGRVTVRGLGGAPRTVRL